MTQVATKPQIEQAKVGDRQNRRSRTTLIVGAIAIGVAVGVAGLTLVDGNAGSAAAVTAGSYERYAEAMRALGRPAGGAAMADSYQQYAEAMKGLTSGDELSAGSVTADSYGRYAEAMKAVSP